MPRMKSQAQIVQDSIPEHKEEVHMATIYIVLRVEDALEVTIPNGAKFPIPLPPIDPHVKEDGELLGYVLALKFIDYNLGDSKTYLSFNRISILRFRGNRGPMQMSLFLWNMSRFLSGGAC